MKTQISRWSFDPNKRRSGIYQQQGRMITDADVNELMELLARRVDDALGEVVGSGVPRSGDNLPLVSGTGTATVPLLRRGTLYVDGLRARLEGKDRKAATFPLTDQADFPWPGPWPTGDQLLYADVWESALSALQDATLLDPGLHGADTSTRTQTLVQVKWCGPGIDPTSPATNPGKGNALLQLAIRAGSSAPDPCDPCAAEIALDERVGNYVFRLEVHDVRGTALAPSAITLKWSSENGAEHHAQASVPPEFKRGDWIYEFYNDESEQLLGSHLAGPMPVRANLSDGWPGASSPLLDAQKLRYVRRWDGCCTLAKSGTAWTLASGALAKDQGIALTALAAGGTPTHGNIELGTDFVAYLRGLTLRLAVDGRQFLAGDYWLASVREDAAEDSRVQLVGEFEESGTGTSLIRRYLPLGITHHYLLLGRMINAAAQTPADPELRRLSFPPLNNLLADRVGYAVPGCTNNTLRSLLWPGAAVTPQRVKEVLDALLCTFDSSKLPVLIGVATAPATVKAALDSLRTDVNAKVNRAGDIMTGGLAIGGTTNPGANNLSVQGNCVINGNLTVQGDATKMNVAEMEVEDAIVRVNRFDTPAPADPRPGNAGLEVFRGGKTENKNAQVVWDEAEDRWKAGVEGNLLPISLGQMPDFVTGVVVFEALTDAEMLSGDIDPGLGPGPISVQLAHEVSPTSLLLGDTNYVRDIQYRTRIDPSRGVFQVFARRILGGRVQARVRWWVMKPGAEKPPVTISVVLTVNPTSATVVPSGTVSFTASVTGTTVGVSWSVVPVAGVNVGSVAGTNTTAVYTAPPAEGVFTVRASCAGQFVDVQVTVRATKQFEKVEKLPTADKPPTAEKLAAAEKVTAEKITVETVKTIEGGGPKLREVIPMPAPAATPAVDPLPDVAGRSFIRPEERPDISLPPGT